MRGATLIAFAVVVLGLEGSAAAQTTKSSSKEPEVIVFPDDKLLDPGTFPSGMLIGGDHRPVRTLLVRPRTHFVAELIKTIENL